MSQPLLDDSILSRIAGLERRLVALERSPQLTQSSIKDGALTIFDASEQPIVVLGRQADGRYGLRVNNASGSEVLRLGEVAAATYGLDAKDPATGNLVQRLVNGLLTIYDGSGVARVKVGKDGADFDVKSLDAAGANAVALSTLARGQAAAFIGTPQETTSSSSYTDLATNGPEITLTIGPSGRAIILGGASATTSTNNDTAAIALYVDGALNRLWAQFGISGTGTADIASGALITGLSAGSHTFKLRYKSQSGVLVGFIDRWLTGWAF